MMGSCNDAGISNPQNPIGVPYCSVANVLLGAKMACEDKMAEAVMLALVVMRGATLLSRL